MTNDSTTKLRLSESRMKLASILPSVSSFAEGKYDLTEAERNFIERMIKPME